MKVLVISVHPDDETLGCGGTILKHSENKDEIFWLILTKVTEPLGYSREFVSKREKQVERVSNEYGFKKIYSLDFPTTRLHTIDFSVIIERMSSVIKEVEPEIIYTVNRSDIHTDHQIAAKAVMSCTKRFRNQFIKRILMYECISETELAPPLPENFFIPNVYADISDFLDKKIKIMKIYASEIQEPPFPRSEENIKALARYRGATVSVKFAEAFMLLMELI